MENSKVLDAKRKPKLFAYGQAGLGYPNPLNFLDSDLAPYALGGLTFIWPLTSGKSTHYQKPYDNLRHFEKEIIIFN